MVARHSSDFASKRASERTTCSSACVRHGELDAGGRSSESRHKPRGRVDDSADIQWRCRGGSVSHPVVRGRGEAAERAVLVSGAGHAPQAHLTVARSSAEETNRYPGGARR